MPDLDLGQYETLLPTLPSHAPQRTPSTLSDQDLLTIYYKMALTRALDDRAWILNRQGKVAFVASCRGHEAAQVGSAYALRPGRDMVVTYYRDLGVALTLGMTPREVMLSSFSRAADPTSAGRQMSWHFSDRRLNLLTASSVVGTQIPHAVGTAVASKLRQADEISIVYFGDGATSEGDFHEALNFAGIHRLPVIFFCENNGYAISAAQHKQMAIRDIADRAQGYGFPGVVVDGLDPLAVYEVTKQAVERARRGDGASLVEAKVHRLRPHSSDDDDRRYRGEEELAEERRNDPLKTFAVRLIEQGVLDEALKEQLAEKAREEGDEAARFAEASPDPEPSELYTHIFSGQ